MMVWPGWKRAAMLLGVFVLLLGGAYRLLHVSMAETYWGRGPSFSSQEARKRGTLVRVVNLEPPAPLWEGEPIHIREAWIEEQARVRYRYYLLRRVIRSGRHWLVLAADTNSATHRLLLSTLDDYCARLIVGNVPMTGTSVTTGQIALFAQLTSPTSTAAQVTVCQRCWDPNARPAGPSVPVCPYETDATPK